MVACRRGHERSPIAGSVLKLQCGVERPSNLERVRRLNDLQLQVDLGAGGAREPVGAPEQRTQDQPLEPTRGVDNLGERRQGCFTPESRISARRPAKADLGSTSSAPAWRAAAIKSTWTCEAKPMVRVRSGQDRPSAPRSC